jgi:hypothetical protein
LYLLGYCRTGLLVLVQGSWYYFYVSYTIQRLERSSPRRPQPAADVINKYRPGRDRPGPKQTGRTRLRLTATDVMHCWARTHKFGNRIPKNIREAMEIDRGVGNTLWMEAIRQEMQNVRVAFEEYSGEPNALIGYTQITGWTPCL